MKKKKSNVFTKKSKSWIYLTKNVAETEPSSLDTSTVQLRLLQTVRLKHAIATYAMIKQKTVLLNVKVLHVW